MKSFIPSKNDLSLAGRQRDSFVSALRTKCLVALAASIVILFALVMMGLHLPISLVMVSIFAGPLLVLLKSIRGVEEEARQHRCDLDLATAVFLDLVNVLLAGGAGIETAILAAVTTGDGWGFSQLRLSIAKSQSSRQSYWDGLRELGQTVGVDSLIEVANSVQLAGEHGARIRQSLSAKAMSLRLKNLARIEYEAEQRTEKMGLPIVLLFFGFILLVGYPAFVGTIGAL